MSNNDSFELSIAAQNIEARFYNKIGIVYVEGDDDILFWAQYFDMERFEIRKVDGCKNLDYYENEILNHGLKCIVAKDADYSSYMHNTQTHPLIVCTLSHSIECIMYCPYNVNACLKKLARTLDDHISEIQRCYDEFCNDTKEMVVYDIANIVYGIGCSVCGDSCLPIMESNHAVKVSSEKRDQFIQKIAPSFTLNQINQTRYRVDNDRRHLRQIMKGHFQTSFVMNLLKKLTSMITGEKKPSISKDVLYALLITCFPECQVYCYEKEIIRKRVKTAIGAL